MSKLRFRVVETAFKKKPVAVAVPAERPSEYFAKYVFNKEKMFRYLPSKVYAKLTDVIDNGAPLDRSIADEVAAGMKKWAVLLPLHRKQTSISTKQAILSSFSRNTKLQRGLQGCQNLKSQDKFTE